MKKILFCTLLLYAFYTGTAQIAGVDFSTARKMTPNTDVVYETMYKMNDGYIIPFEITPVGLKHCVERFSEIADANDLLERDPIQEDVLLADYVDGITDYASLSISLKAGDSELSYAWRVGNWNVGLVMNTTLAAIIFAYATAKN